MRIVMLTVLLLLGASSVAVSAPLPFTVDILGAGKDPVPLTAPSGGGRIRLNLIQTSGQGAPQGLDLMLSQFVSEQGDTASVGLLADPSDKPGAMQHVKIASAAVPIELVVPDLPPGKYIGALTMLAQGYDPVVLKIVLTAPSVFRPATLVVDRGAVTTSVTTCPWIPCLAPTPEAATIHIADKNRLSPLEAVTYRQEPSAKASEFDADRNLSFIFDGTKIERFGDVTSDRTRVVQRGQTATVSMTPRELGPGEYNATLRFQAFNSLDDDGQKLLLTVLVRHCVFWAIVTLLVALAVSFVVTKVLAMLRQRLTLLTRIRDLRPAWLGTMEPVLPVVWVRAMLQQSDDLSRRHWLSGPNLIDARLNQVAGVLGVLEKVHDLRTTFDDAFLLHDFVRVRAVTALGRIVSRMGAGAILDAKATAFKNDLDGLAAWATKIAPSYWDDLVKASQTLLGAVDPQEVPRAGQATIATLKTAIATAIENQPPTLQRMTAVETDYARLKILWERRKVPEFAQLLALQQQPRPLSELFAAADQAAWNRLQTDATREIVLPQDNGIDPLEAYEPLTFSLETPGDPALAETYLFMHGLRYTWAFTLSERKRDRWRLWLKRRPALTFGAVTAEPSVVVYSPDQGILSAQVTVTFLGATLTTQKKTPVTIVKSEDFAVGKGFERVEILSLVFAGVVALVSGLSMLYAKNPTFGTLSDYLGLFLWGVGVDQAKNLAQSLQMAAPSAK